MNKPDNSSLWVHTKTGERTRVFCCAKNPRFPAELFVVVEHIIPGYYGEKFVYSLADFYFLFRPFTDAELKTYVAEVIAAMPNNYDGMGGDG